MKKILMMLAAAAALSSCTIDNRTWQDTDSYLESFCNDLVERTTVRCVEALYGAMNESEPDSGSFTMTFDDGMAVFVERVADGSWSMSCDEGKLQFGLRLSPDDGEELSGWTCSLFAASYDEGNGFTAVLAADGDIRFEWVYTPYSAVWHLEHNGMYAVETYYEGSALDAGFLRYSHGERSFSGERLRY